MTIPYTSLVENYVLGTGKGREWSPPNWSSLSNIISRVMEKNVTGMKVIHPNQSEVQRVLDDFVNNTSR